jgi:phosphatidate cytidylyltransferase
LKNLFQRSVTGALFVILVYGTLFAGSITFLVFFLALSILSLLEFYSHKEKEGFRVQKVTAIFASIILFVLLHGYSSGNIPLRWLSLLTLFPPVMMIRELYRQNEKCFDNLAVTFLGIIYIAVPFSLLNFLVFPDVAHHTYTPDLLAGVFILIMVNDTAAYLIGVPLGRHRLFKSVSPKKSWEGTIGGGVVVIFAAFFMNLIFPLLGRAEWLGTGVIVAVFGVYGDLVESLFKRRLGIKDTGKILPGHGGILDRVDAWLFVIPVIWVYSNFIS